MLIKQNQKYGFVEINQDNFRSSETDETLTSSIFALRSKFREPEYTTRLLATKAAMQMHYNLQFQRNSRQILNEN